MTIITRISNVWQCCRYGARPLDNTGHQTWNKSCGSECGWRAHQFSLSLSSMGLFFLSQFSSLCHRRRANLILQSCTTKTQTSQQTLIPQRVLITDSGFKSMLFHVSENCSTLTLSTKSQSFSLLQEVSSHEHSHSGCILLSGLLMVTRWFNMRSTVCWISRLRRGWIQVNLP